MTIMFLILIKFCRRESEDFRVSSERVYKGNLFSGRFMGFL